MDSEKEVNEANQKKRFKLPLNQVEKDQNAYAEEESKE
jgi:hypothetical protein